MQKILLLILLLALPIGCSVPAPTVTSPSPTVDAAAAAPAPPSANPASATIPDAPSAAALDFPRTFTIDPAASEARYKAQEEFFGRAVQVWAPITVPLARTSEIRGEFVIDVVDVNGAAQPHIVQGAIEVDLRTLASDSDERDERVRDFYLETADFPLALFVPTEVAAFAAGYTPGSPTEFQLSGDMTIREVTAPVTFNINATLDGPTLSGVATSTLLLSDYNIAPPNMAGFVKVEDELLVTVEFTARAQE